MQPSPLFLCGNKHAQWLNLTQVGELSSVRGGVCLGVLHHGSSLREDLEGCGEPMGGVANYPRRKLSQEMVCMGSFPREKERAPLNRHVCIPGTVKIKCRLLRLALQDHQEHVISHKMFFILKYTYKIN